MTDWRLLELNFEETEFRVEGKRALGPYKRALAFYAPGVAPVEDESGWLHIRPDGSPLYPQRYRRAFGYYCARAAVMDDNGWFHLDLEGNPVYAERRPWVGNFQQDLCTVRDESGAYFHIRPDGSRLYSENYLYAGDYYEGTACVKNNDGLFTHIDLAGKTVHGRYYPELGVYHKGFATAGDESGRFHIDKRGFPAYKQRYLFVEPFYNGAAFAIAQDGKQLVVGENGEVLWGL